MSEKTTIDLKYLRSIKAITKLQGRDYLTHPGLLRVAHEHGLKRITNDLVSWDADNRAAVMRCTVEGDRGIYTAYGDASPANVSKNISTATLRMAETRAVNRALRLYTGLGMTTTEELPGDHESLSKPQRPSRDKSEVLHSPVAHGCAVCRRLVSVFSASDCLQRGFPTLCEEHQSAWAGREDPSWNERAFREAIEPLGLDLAALDLRCVASPAWGKRVSQMGAKERSDMLAKLKSHHERKGAK